jgi:hypothetical protein
MVSVDISSRDTIPLKLPVLQERRDIDLFLGRGV